MNELKSELSLWVSCKAFNIDMKMEVVLEILLRDGSMTYPFLSIIDENQNFCLIPITRLIDVTISQTIAIFTFQDYEDIEIRFLFTESRNYEILISQFRLTANISRNIQDDFKDQNIQFLQQNSNPNIQFQPNSQMYNLYETKTGLSPVPFSKEAEEVWVERSTLLNTSYFTETVPIVINICTWNVSSENPTPLATEELKMCALGSPDIAFFSFQEIDMSTKSVVTGSSNKANDWKDIVSSTLNGTNLEIVESLSLGGTFGILAINKNNKNVKFDNSKSTRIGAHGLAANKSFINFNVKAGFANITFVACHLAAHDENLEERNQQLIKIQKSVPRGTDYLFICGDLNYRIALPYEECVPLAVNNELNKLLAKDQLLNMIISKPELMELKEGPITFRPTYRYDKNLDRYDTSQKQRVPSYTDRVLVRTFPPRLTTGLDDNFCFETDCAHHFADDRTKFLTPSYFSPQEPTPNYPFNPQNVFYGSGSCKISDHRAVHAQWKLMIPGTNEERKAKFEQLLKQKFDELTSQEEPQGFATPDKITLKVKETQEVKLENIGLSWAHWNVQTLTDKIAVFPTGGVIIPGIPVTVEITATEYVEGEQFILFMGDQGTLCSIEAEVVKPSLFKSLFKRDKK